MSSETDAEAASLRAASKRYFRATTIIIAVIMTAMALYAAVVLRGVQPSTFFRLALSWSPCLFYLWALLALRRFFGELSTDAPSDRAGITQTLGVVGSALLLGAVTTMLLAPLISMMAPTHRVSVFPL